MIKYEYKHVKYKLESENPIWDWDFNKLGEEGWEMCGMIRGDTGVVFYFKRKI